MYWKKKGNSVKRCTVREVYMDFWFTSQVFELERKAIFRRWHHIILIQYGQFTGHRAKNPSLLIVLLQFRQLSTGILAKNTMVSDSTVEYEEEIGSVSAPKAQNFQALPTKLSDLLRNLLASSSMFLKQKKLMKNLNFQAICPKSTLSCMLPEEKSVVVTQSYTEFWLQNLWRLLFRVENAIDKVGTKSEIK